MPLEAAVYAPFDTAEDYILGWTDLIWDDFGLGRLPEHYAKDVVVHGAYGPMRGPGRPRRVRFCHREQLGITEHGDLSGETAWWSRNGWSATNTAWSPRWAEIPKPSLARSLSPTRLPACSAPRHPRTRR